MRHFLLTAAALAATIPAAAQQAPAPVTAEARLALASFGSCVVARSPKLAQETLVQDFRSPGYREGMRTLGAEGKGCLGDWAKRNGERKVTLRMQGLPFAASVAEALIARGNAPLNVRLAKAAAIQAPTFSPTDRIAMCVARSDPDNTARLLESKVASPEEVASAAALQPVGQRCAAGLGRLDMPPHAMRAMIATASYRLLAKAEAL